MRQDDICFGRHAAEFMGLTKGDAYHLAEKKNLIVRLIRVDTSSFYAYPKDKREDRVCIELDKGKVTTALYT